MGDIGRTKRRVTYIPEDEPGQIPEPLPPEHKPEPVKEPEKVPA